LFRRFFGLLGHGLLSSAWQMTIVSAFSKHFKTDSRRTWLSLFVFCGAASSECWRFSSELVLHFSLQQRFFLRFLFLERGKGTTPSVKRS
jgi:hypothetical protein